MSSLYIVIPAYNESANIERTIDQWYPVVERHNDEGKSRLVIINDGSKDHTYQLLQKCAASRPLLIPLDKPNGGHSENWMILDDNRQLAVVHPADRPFYLTRLSPDEIERLSLTESTSDPYRQG